MFATKFNKFTQIFSNEEIYYFSQLGISLSLGTVTNTNGVQSWSAYPFPSKVY